MARRFADSARRASQRRHRPAARPDRTALAAGDRVRWRGRIGAVVRLQNPLHAMVDFDGKRWLVPVAELSDV
jgi:hypothetical protein